MDLRKKGVIGCKIGVKNGAMTGTQYLSTYGSAPLHYTMTSSDLIWHNDWPSCTYHSLFSVRIPSMPAGSMQACSMQKEPAVTGVLENTRVFDEKYPGVFQYPGFMMSHYRGIDKYPGIWQPVKYPGKWQRKQCTVCTGISSVLSFTDFSLSRSFECYVNGCGLLL